MWRCFFLVYRKVKMNLVQKCHFIPLYSTLNHLFKLLVIKHMLLQVTIQNLGCFELRNLVIFHELVSVNACVLTFSCKVAVSRR